MDPNGRLEVLILIGVVHLVQLLMVMRVAVVALGLMGPQRHPMPPSGVVLTVVILVAVVMS